MFVLIGLEEGSAPRQKRLTQKVSPMLNDLYQ